MTSSLVGSEMCIRDSPQAAEEPGAGGRRGLPGARAVAGRPRAPPLACLLYTSDAADECRS
eukprot:4274171-Prorocentrum_lima.AAC.1